MECSRQAQVQYLGARMPSQGVERGAGTTHKAGDSLMKTVAGGPPAPTVSPTSGAATASEDGGRGREVTPGVLIQGAPYSSQLSGYQERPDVPASSPPLESLDVSPATSVRGPGGFGALSDTCLSHC
jgi:hypothetical protein